MQTTQNEPNLKNIAPCSYGKVLPLYADSQLSEEDHSQVTEHIEGCESCRLKVKSIENSNVYLSEKIPKKLLSPEVAKSIEHEICEIHKIQKKFVEKGPSKFKRFSKDLFGSMTSTQSLKIYLFALIAYYLIRVSASS